MKKIIMLFSAVLVLGSSLNANAGVCNGKVTDVSIKHDGQVIFNLRSNSGTVRFFNVCNIKASDNEVCKSWYSLLLAETLANGSIQLANNSGNRPTNCTSGSNTDQITQIRGY